MSPVVRIHRHLSVVVGKPVLTKEDTEGFVKAITNPEDLEQIKQKKELLFNHTHKHGSESYSLRVTTFVEKDGIGIAIRLIPKLNKGIEELKLPKILSSIIDFPQGLFLIVGPAGHGKSTTMAAMIEEINQKKTVPKT